jgi:hypothetical protein
MITIIPLKKTKNVMSDISSVIRSPVIILAMLILCECVELCCIAHTYVLYYLMSFITQFNIILLL